MKVFVLNRGYFGGAIRDAGETFDFPDEEWADEDKRPSWVEPVDGSVHADDDPADEPKESLKVAPADKPAKGKPGRKPKAAKPDEPQGNGVTEALGPPADWLPPGGADTLKDGDE